MTKKSAMHPVFFILAIVSASCGGSSSPGAPSAATPATYTVTIQSTAALGSFSASFQGQTITTPGPRTFQLAPGQYQITGQMNSLNFGAAIFGMLFTKSQIPGVVTLEGGGVQWASVKSLAGPNPAVSQCSVVYDFDGTGSRAFQIQFNVTSSTAIGAYCP